MRKVVLLLLVLAPLTGCMTPAEQENIREAERYVKVSQAEVDGLQRELQQLRALGVKSDAVDQKEKELASKLSLAEDALKKAKVEQEKAVEAAKAQRLARGVQIAEWAHGIVSTGVFFTPFAGIAAPILGALGALIAGYKKKEVPVA